MRAGTFSNTVHFFEMALGLRVLHRDPEREFARFQLPGRQVLEVLGPKNIWQPFTTPPAWVLIVADVLYSPVTRDMADADDQQANA